MMKPTTWDALAASMEELLQEDEITSRDLRELATLANRAADEIDGLDLLEDLS